MDLTEGAPNGAFMSILVRDLIAKTAMIERIQAELIQVQNAIFGGERFSRSGDSVIDNGAGKIGFMLGADGRLIASDVIISGIINALSGRFSNVEILGNSLFQGNITSGPLVLSNDSPTGVTHTLNSGASAIEIRNVMLTAAGEPINNNGTYTVTGSYSNKQLVKIGYIYDYRSPNGTNFELSIYAYFSDGTNSRIAFRKEQSKDVVTNNTISSPLTFAFTTTGKTFKLTNLPSTPIAPNVVYKDSDGFLKIG
jgi:hypothetical protein